MDRYLATGFYGLDGQWHDVPTPEQPKQEPMPPEARSCWEAFVNGSTSEIRERAWRDFLAEARAV